MNHEEGWDREFVLSVPATTVKEYDRVGPLRLFHAPPGIDEYQNLLLCSQGGECMGEIACRVLLHWPQFCSVLLHAGLPRTSGDTTRQ